MSKYHIVDLIKENDNEMNEIADMIGKPHVDTSEYYGRVLSVEVSEIIGYRSIAVIYKRDDGSIDIESSGITIERNTPELMEILNELKQEGMI